MPHWSKLSLTLFLFLFAGTVAGAGGRIPAIDLPLRVPEPVRDDVARSLSRTRDTLGWRVRPFRGEFHGLGSPAGGRSEANDLSADGRVVVGADYNASGRSEAFVWSPWTGRSVYDMRPTGVTGDVIATAVSADGVYVAGNVTPPPLGNVSVVYRSGESHTFRWSLAAREPIGNAEREWFSAIGLSGDGDVVVGTVVDHGGFGSSPFFAVDRTAFNFRSASDVTNLPEGFLDSTTAVGVSTNGRVVLGNARWSSQFAFTGEQPVLWRDGKPTYLGRLGGSLDADSLLRSDDRTLSIDIGPNAVVTNTTANALSADGSTVVGIESSFPYYISSGYDLGISRRAILWREDTGWIELGHLPHRHDEQLPGSSSATDVSGDGRTVIGTASYLSTYDLFTQSSPVPFLWDESRGMRDLGDVLRHDYGLDFSGWELGEATAISDDGTTIIGNGTNPAGQAEAWRAVLERNTPHGDLDFDGDVDHVDHQTLAANLGRSAGVNLAVFYSDGDLNADGQVDEADQMALWGLYEGRRLGDFNADGVVDAADYSVWRDHQASTTGVADSNGNGRVDAGDLVAWRWHYGRTITGASAAAVPEASSFAVAIAALVTALFRRP